MGWGLSQSGRERPSLSWTFERWEACELYGWVHDADGDILTSEVR
jgi:hypothetical protein